MMKGLRKIISAAPAAMMLAATACTPAAEKPREGGTPPPLVSFCAGINYGDTTVTRNKGAMKRAVATIAGLLPTADSVTAREALTIFFNGLRRDEKALTLATGLADSYLGGLSSPTRDEGKYITVLEALVGVGSLPGYVRDAAAERLRIARLNRPGSRANDFSFEERGGGRGSLYGIGTEWTLVVFYDPECPHCSDILKGVAADRTINAAVSAGRLTVAAIYAEGKRDAWRSNLKEMPGNWTVGYDLSAILDNDLYDLPAMPTLYLLDREKRVVLKDPDYRQASRYLRGR